MKHAIAIDVPGPGRERQAKLASLLFSGTEVVACARRVYTAMLESSAQIRSPNFRVIGTDDLERMFDLYDREFFRGLLGEMLVEDRAHPMGFRLSRGLPGRPGRRCAWSAPGRSRAGSPSGSTTRSRFQPRSCSARSRMSSAT